MFQPGVLWVFCGKSRRLLKGLIFDPDRGFFMFEQQGTYCSFPWPDADTYKKPLKLTPKQFIQYLDSCPQVPGTPEFKHDPRNDDDASQWKEIKVKFI